MPNMTPREANDVIAELYGSPIDDEERVAEGEQTYPGAYAVVRLVVDQNQGLCVDDRGAAISTQLLGETNKTIAEAMAAAQAEVTRLQGCTSQNCYDNPSQTAQALGSKIANGQETDYAVIAFIAQQGNGGDRIREILDDKKNNYKWLNYEADSSAIDDNCS